MRVQTEFPLGMTWEPTMRAFEHQNKRRMLNQYLSGRAFLSLGARNSRTRIKSMLFLSNSKVHCVDRFTIQN